MERKKKLSISQDIFVCNLANNGNAIYGIVDDKANNFRLIVLLLLVSIHGMKYKY